MKYYEQDGVVYDEEGRKVGTVKQRGDNTPVRDYQGEYMDSLSTPHKWLIGAGAELDRLWKGANQPWMTPEQKAQAEQERNLYKPLQEHSPWSTGFGTALPYLATFPLGSLKAQMAIGGGAGALGFGTPGQRMEGALYGAGGAYLGHQIGQMGGRLINYWKGLKAAPKVGGETGRLLSRADDLGFQTTPGQQLQGKGLRRFEAAMERHPLFASVAGEMREANEKQLARILSRKGLGLKEVDEITPAVLDDARRLIGGTLDDIANKVDRVGLSVDDLRGVQDIFENAQGGIARPKDIRVFIKRFLNMAKGEGDDLYLTGKDLLKARSDFRALGKKAWKDGDEALATALNDMEDLTLSLIERGVGSADDMAKYATAREQWKVYRAIADTKPDGGRISAAKIANKLATADKSGYTLGQNTGDVYDAIRFSRNVGQPVTGTSGTAENLAAMQMLQQPGKSLAYYLGGKPLYSSYADGMVGTLMKAANQGAPMPGAGTFGGAMGIGYGDEQLPGILDYLQGN